MFFTHKTQQKQTKKKKTIKQTNQQTKKLKHPIVYSTENNPLIITEKIASPRG